MSNEERENEEPTYQSIYSDKDNQIIRLQSSDIAAIAGYHPYKNKLELLEKYLYQDLQHLLVLDAKNMGIELIDKDQEISGIIKQLPALDAATLGSLREAAAQRLVDPLLIDMCRYCFSIQHAQ